jgi:hypothetical protein
MRGAKPRVAADVDDHRRDEYEQGALHECATIEMVSPSNENKMSDGWRESASLRVEGGSSRGLRNHTCQPFAPSHG